MQIETLRTKLIKIAAKRVKQSRRIVFKLCSHYPYKEIFHHCFKNDPVDSVRVNEWIRSLKTKYFLEKHITKGGVYPFLGSWSINLPKFKIKTIKSCGLG